MGLGENCGPDDSSHTTEYFQFFEKVTIPRLNIRIPGFKRRIEIRENTSILKGPDFYQEHKYASLVETYLLFLGKSIHRTFHPVNSPGAQKILQRYKPGLVNA